MTRAKLGGYLIVIGLCFVACVGILMALALTSPQMFLPFLGVMYE